MSNPMLRDFGAQKGARPQQGQYEQNGRIYDYAGGAGQTGTVESPLVGAKAAAGGPRRPEEGSGGRVIGPGDDDRHPPGGASSVVDECDRF